MEFEEKDFKLSEQQLPRWIRDYQARGGRIFTKGEKLAFAKLSLLFKKVYIPYVDSFVKNLMTETGRAARGRRALIDDLLKTKKVMQSVIVYIADVLLGEKKHEPSKDEVANLFRSIAVVQRKIALYVQTVVTDQRLREVTDKLKSETGVDIEQIAKTTGLAERHLKTFAPKPAWQARAKAAAPEAFELGRSALLGGVGAMFGPFAQLGMVAGKTITGMIKRHREAALARQKEKFETAIGVMPKLERPEAETIAVQRGVSSPLKERVTAPAVQGLSKKRSEPFKVSVAGEEIEPSTLPPKVLETLKAEAAAMGTPSIAPAREPVGKKGLGVGMGVTANTFVAGLLLFFNKQAYVAKWTKELLETMKKLSKGVSKGGMGLLDWLGLGWLSKWFGGIARVVGGAATGALGVGRGLLGGFGALGGGVGIGGALMGLAKGGLWGGLLKGGATMLGASKLAAAIPGIAKFAGVLSKFAGPIGWILTGIQAIWGAFKGVKATKEIFGLKPGEKATLGQKIAAGLGGAIQDLTFGLVKKEKVAKWAHGISVSIGKSLSGFFRDLVQHPFKTLGKVAVESANALTKFARTDFAALAQKRKAEQQRNIEQKKLAQEAKEIPWWELKKKTAPPIPKKAATVAPISKAAIPGITPTERTILKDAALAREREELRTRAFRDTTEERAIATEQYIRQQAPERLAQETAVIRPRVQAALGRIPTTPSTSEAVSTAINKLDTSFKKLAENVAKAVPGGGVTAVKKTVTEGGHNTGDTLVEMLNLGNMGIAV